MLVDVGWRWTLSQMLVLAGAALFVPAVVAASTLVTRARALARAGVVLAFIGAVFTGVLVGVTTLAASALAAPATRAAGEPERAVQALVDMRGAIPIAFGGAFLLPLGLLLLGVALVSTRIVPLWPAVAVAVGGVVLGIGTIHCRLPVLLNLEEGLQQEDTCVPGFLAFGDVHWIRAVGAALVLAGFTALAWRRAPARRPPG